MNGYSDDLRRRMLRDTEEFLSRHLNETRRAAGEIQPSGKFNVLRARSNVWVCILTGKRAPLPQILILAAATRFQQKSQNSVPS